jgi:hypothetical protein
MNPLLRFTFLVACLLPTLMRAQMRIDKHYGLSMLPDARKHGLKGKVWKLTQTQSPLSNKAEDLLDGYSGQNYTEEYNRRGYLQKHISRDDFNKPRRATYYAYDANDRVTALWDESLAPDQFGLRTDGRIDYEYADARNAIIVRDNRTIMGKARHHRTETVRDTVNRMLTLREYQHDTLLTRDERVWWDQWGYVTKRTTGYRNVLSDRTELKKEDVTQLLGALSEQEERALDSLLRARDSLATRHYRSRPEWMTDTTIYRNDYDKQGRLVIQETYRNNRRTDVVTYAYGPDATQVTRQSFDMKGDLNLNHTTRLPPVEGYVLSSRTRRKTEGKSETSDYNSGRYPKAIYRHRYDSHGNWIEQKQVDGVGKQIGPALIRLIEYY